MDYHDMPSLLLSLYLPSRAAKLQWNLGRMVAIYKLKAYHGLQGLNFLID